MIERTLLINQSFALRQRGGLPVFTSIEMKESPYKESEIDNIIDNLNKQKKAMGLITTNFFDVKYKENLKETPKKIRVKIDYPINLSTLERIIITPNARGYISTYFLEFCKVQSISIYWVDGKGKLEASFIPFHYLKPTLALKQYETRTNGKGLEIAKYLIRLKLESQGMNRFMKHLDNAKDIITIIRLEGSASDLYFEKWSIPEEFQWKGRGGRKASANTNAVDSVNTMLNFGYGILVQQMSEILLGRGFELSIGFLHATGRFWNQLSYDFIEPFRVWIDDCVKEMIAKREIRPNDFTFSEDKSSMIFKDKAIGIALNKFMETLDPLEHKSLPIIRRVEKMLGESS